MITISRICYYNSHRNRYGGQLLDTSEIARRAVNAASDKLASDIVLLDTRGENRFTSYFVICSADSPRQMQAVRDEIAISLKKIGATLHHDEGNAATGWLLLDYGDIVVHIFGSREREFYKLDQLWADAAVLLRIQ